MSDFEKRVGMVLAELINKHGPTTKEGQALYEFLLKVAPPKPERGICTGTVSVSADEGDDDRSS